MAIPTCSNCGMALKAGRDEWLHPEPVCKKSKYGPPYHTCGAAPACNPTCPIWETLSESQRKVQNELMLELMREHEYDSSAGKKQREVYTLGGFPIYTPAHYHSKDFDKLQRIQALRRSLLHELCKGRQTKDRSLLVDDADAMARSIIRMEDVEIRKLREGNQ